MQILGNSEFEVSPYTCDTFYKTFSCHFLVNTHGVVSPMQNGFTALHIWSYIWQITAL